MKITLWQKEENLWSEENRNKHFETLELLRKIKEQYNIEFEVIANFEPREVYGAVFLKNRTMLKKRTGRGVNDLRSHKGNVYVDGVVAVYDDSGEIIYYVLPWEKEQFLNNLLTSGSSYVQGIVDENLLKAAKDLPEDKLIVDFLSNALQYGYDGQIKREYALVRPIKPDSNMSDDVKDFIKSFSYIAAKNIDMLHIAKDGSYDIIEAKINLNWEALGQAIGYRKIFCELNSIPLERTKAVILCRESDGFIEYVCDSLNIKVITLPSSTTS